jgi:hypothetical protein
MSDRDKRIKAIDEIVKTLDEIERKSLHEKEEDKQVYMDVSGLTGYGIGSTATVTSGYYATTAALYPSNIPSHSHITTHSPAPINKIDKDKLVKMGNYVDDNDKYVSKKGITNFLSKLWK